MLSISKCMKKNIRQFLPPGNWLERIMRFYWRDSWLAKLVVHIEIKRANQSHYRWVRRNEISVNKVEVPHQVEVAFLLSVRDNDIYSQISAESDYKEFSTRLDSTLLSLQQQFAFKWILYIFTDSAEFDSYLLPFKCQDDRIQLVPRSENGFAHFLSLLQTEYLVFLSAGTQLSPNYSQKCAEKLGESQHVDILYTDSDVITPEGTYESPFFKPTQFSPELLLSVNYLAHSMIHGALLKTVYQQYPDDEFSPGWNRYIAMRCACLAGNIVHVPGIFIHESELNKDTDQIADNMILRYLQEDGLPGARVDRMKDNQVHISWQVEWPRVSIIIPTKDNVEILKQLLDSNDQITDYPEYEILIVDNGSKKPETLAYYRTIENDSHFKILEYDQPFNYSRANNLGASVATGELFLFMNDDMEVFNPRWLKELVQWALVESVGITGAKLLYPNRRIQHAGIIIGLNGFVDHIYARAPERYHGLWGSVNWYRNVGAVTGACQMMRKCVFEELGGYDEGYELVFGDVDLCLRASRLGYRTMYNPFADIIHHEGYSRRGTIPIDDTLRAVKQIETIVANGDRYYSPFLTYTSIPHCAEGVGTHHENYAWMQEKIATLQSWQNS